MSQTDLKASGVIIRITNFKESDQIFDLFTSEGDLIGFFARSSRKPKSKLHGIVSIGNFVSITYSKGKNLNYPKEINYDLEKLFTFQKNSLPAMYFYADLLAITRSVAKDFQEKELYTLLLDSFEKAQKVDNSKLIEIYNDFLTNLLELLGIDATLRSFTSGQMINEPEFYYHAESNSAFTKTEKPTSMDLPLISSDQIFMKNYLTKLLSSNFNFKIRLKF